jgi:hypothetical protein
MEPRWHGEVRKLYTVAFVLVWLEAVGSFVCFLILAREGSPVATLRLSAAVVNHSQIFYVPVWHKELYHLMLTVMMIGIPTIMLIGFVLHHLVGVRIFTGRE